MLLHVGPLTSTIKLGQDMFKQLCLLDPFPTTVIQNLCQLDDKVLQKVDCLKANRYCKYFVICYADSAKTLENVWRCE